MKRNKFRAPSWVVALFLSLLIPGLAQAQQYSIWWHSLAGGAATSTGGVYSVSGSIGQPEAGTGMSGGSYSLIGGFWSVVNAVQSAGAPLLSVMHAGNNIVLSWPAQGNGCVLENNSTLSATNNWSAVPTSPVTVNGFNYVTNSLASGSSFYRLRHQ